MYKAIHAQTGEEIIILNPTWRKRIQALRELDRADLLICQGCRQPLRVKAGALKRAHFAHKHLQACSFGSESPEILNARAVLYEWLLSQFYEGVTLEKQIVGVSLPRPIDCWVETGSAAFGYWLIEAGIKLEPREAICAALDSLRQRHLPVHVIFLQAMLNEEKKEFHSLLLTPTERAFLQPTPFDQAQGLANDLDGEAGRSIHYLDAGHRTLTTFRGLGLFHRPNWFKGVKKYSPLQAVRIGRLDGEPVHPGERERLGAFYQRQKRRAEKRDQFASREGNWATHLAQRESAWPAQSQSQSLTEQVVEINEGQPARQAIPLDSTIIRPHSAASDSSSTGAQPELPCVICGQLTTDYWYTFFDATGRKLCRCRECLDREMAEGKAVDQASEDQ